MLSRNAYLLGTIDEENKRISDSVDSTGGLVEPYFLPYDKVLVSEYRLKFNKTIDQPENPTIETSWNDSFYSGQAYIFYGDYSSKEGEEYKIETILESTGELNKIVIKDKNDDLLDYSFRSENLTVSFNRKDRTFLVYENINFTRSENRNPQSISSTALNYNQLCIPNFEGDAKDIYKFEEIDGKKSIVTTFLEDHGKCYFEFTENKKQLKVFRVDIEDTHTLFIDRLERVNFNDLNYNDLDSYDFDQRKSKLDYKFVYPTESWDEENAKFDSMRDSIKSFPLIKFEGQEGFDIPSFRYERNPKLLGPSISEKDTKVLTYPPGLNDGYESGDYTSLGSEIEMYIAPADDVIKYTFEDIKVSELPYTYTFFINGKSVVGRAFIQHESDGSVIDPYQDIGTYFYVFIILEHEGYTYKISNYLKDISIFSSGGEGTRLVSLEEKDLDLTIKYLAEENREFEESKKNGQ